MTRRARSARRGSALRVLAAAAALASAPLPARAGPSCSDDHELPAIPVLQVGRGEVALRLAGPAPLELILRPGAGWSVSALRAPRHAAARPQPSCRERVGALRLSSAALLGLRPQLAEVPADKSPPELGAPSEQEAQDCVDSGGYRWFGIGFYPSEGQVGAGGVGRLQLSSGKRELRRPLALVDASVDQIAVEGEQVWLGTAEREECGDVPHNGLLRYDWANNRVHAVPQACGMHVYDIQFVDRELWVVGDLGLSIGSAPDAAGERRWQHYVPEPANAQQPLRPVSCTQLYDALLAAPVALHPVDLFRNTAEQLLSALATVRPEQLSGRETAKASARAYVERLDALLRHPFGRAVNALDDGELTAQEAQALFGPPAGPQPRGAPASRSAAVLRLEGALLERLRADPRVPGPRQRLELHSAQRALANGLRVGAARADVIAALGPPNGQYRRAAGCDLRYVSRDVAQRPGQPERPLPELCFALAAEGRVRSIALRF